MRETQPLDAAAMNRLSVRSFAPAIAGLLAGLLLLVPAVARANTRSQLLYARGLIPFQAKNWEAAYRLFEQAVRADPSDALATYYRGLTAARLGLWNVALQDVQSAVRLQPDIPRAALDLGIIHFELGQYESAEKWFEDASRQACCRLTGALFRGLTRYRLGDDAGALTFLRQAEDDPDLRLTARYYSALALLRQGEADKARSLLVAVEADRPDSEVGRVAADYLSKVSPRRGVEFAQKAPMARPWSVRADAGFEYDSNVVLAPDDSTIKETRGISDEADGRFRVDLGGRYRVATGGPVSLMLGYDFSQSIHFNLTQFDLQGHELQAEVTSPWRGVELGFRGDYDFYALDYRSYLQQGSGTPWVTFFEGERGATRLYYSLGGHDYLRAPFEPYLDSIHHAAGIRQLYAPSQGKGLLSLGYQLDYDDPLSSSGAEFEYLGHQLEITYACPLYDWARLHAGYAFRLDDYQSVNSRTGTDLAPAGTRRRHDSQHQLALQIERELVPQWTVAFSYIGVMNSSNIDPFEYDRQVVGLNLSYQF
jgi:tetratricopeptide (TPR) repeat protein